MINNKNISEESFILKNHLYSYNQKELEDVYLKDFTSYIVFLSYLNCLLKEDPHSIMAIDEARGKIYSLIMDYRNEIKKEKTILEYSNKTIIDLNKLDNLKEEHTIYLLSQLLERNWNGSFDDVGLLLAYDYELISSLRNGDFSGLEPNLVASSTTYLLKNFFSFYIEDPTYFKKNIEYLKKTKNTSGNKREINKAIKLLKKARL